MAKFLGVISNRYQHPSDNSVLEFTDLDLIANCLFHETQNLLYEFQRKSEVITEQEINLCQNLNKILEIYNTKELMNIRTLEMGQELERIEFYLKKLEKSIDCLDRVPTNFVACKCTSNPERSVALETLIKISEECMAIEEQIEQVMKEENWACINNPCDMTRNLLLFLDLHTQILESIEQKSDKVTDKLKEVDGLFINAYKRSIGACYHKPRHDIAYSSSC